MIISSPLPVPAYRANATGPNLSLQPSTSVQAEVGIKYKSGEQMWDMALFDARSKQEIVPASVVNGRSIFQNVDGVRRRGIEMGWQRRWDKLTTRAAYTLLDASFQQAFQSGSSNQVAAGNRLPGAPRHSLYAELGYQFNDAWSAGADVRTESRVFVNDINSDAASGYAVVNAHAGYALRLGSAKVFVFGRIDNVFDKQYAGSIIVNDSNSRYFEPAPGRRFFVGLRTAL
jgi:iron complex outermembrane receptor protein